MAYTGTPYYLRPPTVGKPNYLEREGGGTSANVCCYLDKLKGTALEDHICKFIDMEVQTRLWFLFFLTTIVDYPYHRVITQQEEKLEGT